MMNGGKVVYIGEHTPWPSYICVTRDKGYPESRRYYQRETCRIEERHGDWYCTECGEMVGTCDTASELCIDGNAIELWNYCPNCGGKVER